MAITAIVILIAIGVLLIVLEFLVIPGTAYAGIGGMLLVSGGVFLSYHNYGVMAGNFTLGGTAVFIAATVFYALRSGTWKRLMLKAEVDSTVETFAEGDIQIGNLGVTISRLAPMGKVLINDIYLEAMAHNELIDQNTQVEVIKVLSNKVIVKPATEKPSKE